MKTTSRTPSGLVPATWSTGVVCDHGRCPARALFEVGFGPDGRYLTFCGHHTNATDLESAAYVLELP